MTRWVLCSVELGAVANGSLRHDHGGTVVARPRWSHAVLEEMHAASRALAADDSAALHAALAPEVQIQSVGDAPRVLTRGDAVAELLAWRRGWQSCDVVLAEVLMSGRLYAATGFVVGIGEEGTPSCVDIHLVWSLRV